MDQFYFDMLLGTTNINISLKKLTDCLRFHKPLLSRAQIVTIATNE
jgi:hypothetical protein